MLETSQQNSTNRVVELDALRAMAAVNLMLFHFTHVYQVKYGFTTPLGFEWPFGKYGVQLFFMLSGFVNAMTLCRKQECDEFVTSRLIRIIPMFGLVVALNVFLLTLIPLSTQNGFSFGQVLANLTLMPNLFGFDCLEPVTWTLQIEVLFYGILVALFLSGALRKPFRPLMLYMLLSLVGGILVKNLTPPAANSVAGQLLVFSHSALLLEYMPLFAIGILLHDLKSNPANRWLNSFGIMVSIAVFHAIDDHGHNPLATGILLGLLSLAAYGKLPMLRWKMFLYLSGISYSLYLLHNNLGCVVMYYLNPVGVPPTVSLFLIIVFSLALASAATYWVERPATKRLRNRWKQFQPIWRQWNASMRTQFASRGLMSLEKQ